MSEIFLHQVECVHSRFNSLELRHSTKGAFGQFMSGSVTLLTTTVVDTTVLENAVTTNLLTVSGAAREIGRRLNCVVRPRAISTLLYERHVDDRLCPIIAGHRMISPDVLPLIEQTLIERGVIAVSSEEDVTNAS